MYYDGEGTNVGAAYTITNCVTLNMLIFCASISCLLNGSASDTDIKDSCEDSIK